MRTAEDPEDSEDSASEGLEVTRRRWVLWLWLPVIAVIVAVGFWWMSHPEALPTSDASVTASAKTGQTVFAGVVVEGDVERDLAISSVKLRTVSDSADELDEAGLEVEAWVCRDGAISQTTQPERFCAAVLPAEGNTLRLGGGDQLMVSVSSESPVALHLDQLEVTYRDGLQRATQPFGPEFEIVVLG